MSRTLQWALGYNTPNENLLRNPTFSINQRGVEAVGASNGFYRDGWVFRGTGNTGGSYTAFQNQIDSPAYDNEYMRINHTGATDDLGYIYQGLEFKDAGPLFQSGGAFTFSGVFVFDNEMEVAVRVEEITAANGTVNLGEEVITIPANDLTRRHITLNLQPLSAYVENSAEDDYLRFFIFYRTKDATPIPDGNYRFSDVKFEKGYTPTKFIEPYASEELAKCQRFYARLDQSVYGLTYSQTADKVFFSWDLPVYMRKDPVVTVNGVGSGATVDNTTSYNGRGRIQVYGTATAPSSCQINGIEAFADYI